MSSVEVLRQTEIAIVGLSESDRKELFKKFSRSSSEGIEKNNGDGRRCVYTPHTNPCVVASPGSELGMREADLLKSYPGLTTGDLANAWEYVGLNSEEIESHIKSNERDDCAVLH